MNDPLGECSIEIDTSGMCVILPPPAEPCVSGDPRALASQALAGTPGADAVFVARRLDQLEIVTVVRNPRTDDVELDSDDIAENARDLAKSAAARAAIRSAGEMTTREQRVNGAQMITYSVDLQLDALTGPTPVTWESRVLYGRTSTCWVSIFADAANIQDARSRAKRAVSTLHVEPARLRGPREDRWWLMLVAGLVGVEVARRYRKARSAR